MASGDSVVVWSAVSAIAAVVGTSIVAVAAFVAVWQVREAEAARRLSAGLRLLAYIEDPEFDSTRDFLRNKLDRGALERLLAGKDTNALEDVIREASAGARGWSEVRRFLVRVEHICVLVLHDWSVSDYMFTYLGRTLPAYWRKLEPMIIVVRAGYGSSAFLQHFEAVAMLFSDPEFARASARARRAMRQKSIAALARTT